MKSYHNDPAVKAFHVAQAQRHYDMGMLVTGIYVENINGAFKGCSVGCMAREINPKSKKYHAVVAKSAGWPEWLVHLNDALFEGLPEGDRERFHVELREAVPVGVDLEPVKNKFLLAMQRRNLARIADNTASYAQKCRVAIERVIELLEADEPSGSAAWAAAVRSAEAAEAEAEAEWEAEAAVVAARKAAEAAARSAEWVEAAAAAAAWAAAEARVAARWATARYAESQQQRDDLFSLIRECGNV